MLTEEIMVTHDTPMGRCRHGLRFGLSDVRHYEGCFIPTCARCREMKRLLHEACPFDPADPVRVESSIC